MTRYAGDDLLDRIRAPGRLTLRLVLASLLLAGLCAVRPAESGLTGSTNQLDLTLVSASALLQAQDDAGDKAWQLAPEYTVPLHIAPAVHQSIALQHDANRAGQPPSVQVAAISDGDSICFRLRWDDETENRTSRLGEYRDAAALQFPLSTAVTGIVMGSPDAPVYIWFWKADTNAAEELIAGGPGTVSDVPGRGLARGLYRQRSGNGSGQWLVVFSQKLSDASAKVPALGALRSLPVAFAVWQGQRAQRDGHKYVSDWHEVRLEPLGAAR